AGLKEAYCSIGSLWRVVGGETGVIQSAPANRIGVLVGYKRFPAPGDGACYLVKIPRWAAKSGIVLCALGGPPRALVPAVGSQGAEAVRGNRGYLRLLPCPEAR